MKKRFHFVLIISLAFACTNRKQQVDQLILGPTIYSMDKDSTTYTAMAISNGKIIALGEEKEFKQKYSSKNVISLHGKFIYPGFIDAHSHFYGLGESLVNVDLRGLKSEEEMIQKLKSINSVEGTTNNKKTPTSIIGRGWDQNLWKEKKFPTNTELNKLFPDIPVCLTRIDGHAALVNQKALDLAGITVQSKISGGDFIKENGKLTGVLIDNAVDLVKAQLPEPSKEEKKEIILKAQNECLKYGLTTVTDAGIDKELIELYSEMHASGELILRIYAMANPTQPTLGWLIKNGPVKEERLHVQSVKYYMDGAMGSRGACLLEDYTDQPNNRGFLLNSTDSLKALAILLRENNLQLNVHCIGDSANRITLKIMADVLGTDTTRRWRIEHLQLISASDLIYLKKCRIIPSMQPTHATSDASWVSERLGNERLKYAYALKTCLANAGMIALGTDFPVEEINPFYTFYSAITRKNPTTGITYDWLQAEKLTRYQTLQGMTIWAAYAQFEESDKGSLEPNKLADFIVMDKDLFQVSEEEVASLRPSQVYINGKLVAGK
jgi:predicted amidohydrolase YtcJ